MLSHERLKFMASVYGWAFAVYVIFSLLTNALASGWYLLWVGVGVVFVEWFLWAWLGAHLFIWRKVAVELRQESSNDHFDNPHRRNGSPNPYVKGVGKSVNSNI